MKLNRREFLSSSAPVMVAGTGLLTASPLSGQGYGGTAAPPPHPVTDRTVVLVGDAAPITPQARVQLLGRLLEKETNASDSYLAGGAITELETAVAAMLGKEAAAFFTTGTLANNVAVRVLSGESRHVLVQHDSHLYLDESDSAEMLGGLNLVPLAAGKVGPSYEEVAAAIEAAEHGPYPLKVGAISLESPVRRHDGGSIPFAELERISGLGKQHGIRMHWDGARSLLLSGTPGFDLRRTSALFDTVYVSLYKYLGAPFGAVLAGTKETIAKARELRHIYGGLIYQGWQAVLPAMDALPGFPERFVQARAQGERVLAGLAAKGFAVERVPNESNIMLVRMPTDRVKETTARLAAADVRARIAADGTMPFFINESIVRRPAEELVKAFTG